jgi:hypothetical protein
MMKTFGCVSRWLVVCGALILHLDPEAAAAQPAPVPAAPRAATATRVDTAPIIDGRIERAEWASAESLGDFVQHEPFEGTPATERTDVRIVFTPDALYVGASLYDSDASRIVVGERRRDVTLEDSDAFLVVLDTFRDRQNGFLFGTNPGGIEHDGQVRGEGQPNTNWDGSWTVATSQDSLGWYAEMRIPFATLRYGADEEQEWGLNLVRYIGRKNEQVVWSPVPRHFRFYRLTEAGTLAGLEPPSRRVATVTPYALGAAQRVPSIDPDVDYPFEVGVDAKLGITPSLLMDLTLNTDFAQVEVDDQQVDLSRYSLFFPEKRPFFLENAGLFSIGLDQLPGRTGGRTLLFHSRRIGVADGQQVPIEWGSRLSGRVGGMDVGLFHMNTGGLETVQDPTRWTVARAARELPGRSQIGAIFTSRISTDSPGDYNRSYAVNGRLGIGDIWTFTAVAGRTESPGVDDGEELFGIVGEFLTRNWYIRSYHDRIGENFSPEIGFVPYVGYHESSLRVERIMRPETSLLREVRTHLRRTWRHDIESGFKELDFRHWHLNVLFENGGVFSPSLNWQIEGLDEPFSIRGTDIVVPVGTYSGWTSAGVYSTNPAAPISLSGRYDLGSFLSGDRLGGTLGVSFRRGATLSGGVSVSHNRLDFPEGNFNTTLSSVRLQYAFSPGVFLQSLLQYSDQTGIWSGNVRFGWLDTAGTGLFLVYNERQTMDVTGLSGLLPRNSLETPERTLVIKFTRQFDVSGLQDMLDD